MPQGVAPREEVARRLSACLRAKVADETTEEPPKPCGATIRGSSPSLQLQSPGFLRVSMREPDPKAPFGRAFEKPVLEPREKPC